MSDIRAEMLIKAKHLGFNAGQVRFSSKLVWVSDDEGAVRLRYAAVDRRSQAVTLHLDAMKSRWDGDVIERNMMQALAAALRELLTKTLYVHRPLLNAEDVIAWAKASGFETTLTPEDMHVTVAFSKKPVDQTTLDENETDVTVTGGSRSVVALGDKGAVVLKFVSSDLTKRWQEFIDAGASWDWPSYQPHVTLTYDGDDIDLSKIKPYTGPLIFGPEVFGEVDETWSDNITEKDWNEEEHPRDEDGKFTFSGGGPSEGDEGAYGGLVMPADPPIDTSATKFELNPEAIAVGGDEWNKETAVRLETQYAEQKANISAIADKAVGIAIDERSGDEEDDGDGAPFVPDEWASLNDNQQSDAESQYMSKTYDEYYESEVTNWMENDEGGALRDALFEISNDVEKDDWAKDALIANYTFHGVDVDPPSGDDEPVVKTDLKFSINEILNALKVEVNDGDSGSHYKPYLDIEFDDAELDKALPDGFSPDQQPLPGFDADKASNYLTTKQREAIIIDLQNAGGDAAQKLVDDGKVEPPDYLSDSVKEFQEESWGGMSDHSKFDWVEHNTNIISDIEKEYEDYTNGKKTPELASLDEMPDKFDPLNETSGADYKRTQALATFVSCDRAADLIVARGIMSSRGTPFDKEGALLAVEAADSRLWNGWKSSSAGGEGWLLQVATHSELGGRLRENVDSEHTHKIAVDFANERFKTVGGFEGVKAIVRAKWETTQYLLDKAGMQTVDTYRGLKVSPEGKIEEVEGNKWQDPKQNVSGATIYEKVADFKLVRNGAQSATTDINVAQNFAGSNGTVLRLKVPRTAIISVPAFGQNIYTEHEVVVAGAAYKGWDAWRVNFTPTYDAVPLQVAS